MAGCVQQRCRGCPCGEGSWSGHPRAPERRTHLAHSHGRRGIRSPSDGMRRYRTNLTLHDTPGLVDRLPQLADEFGTWCRSASAARSARTTRRWITRSSRATRGTRCRTRTGEPAHEAAGTAGHSARSGNHYVDVFAGEGDRLWVGLHFGSRGFGHTVASAFLAGVAGREMGPARARAESPAVPDTPIG